MSVFLWGVNYLMSSDIAKLKTIYGHSLYLSPVAVLGFFGMLGLVVNLSVYSSWGVAHTIYVSGLAAFIISYIFTKIVISSLYARVHFAAVVPTSWLRPSREPVVIIYWVLGIAGSLVAMYAIIFIGVLGDKALFFNLRYAHTVEKSSIPFLGHLSLFSFALSLLYAYRGQAKLSVILLLMSILGSIAVAERTGILMKIMAVFYVFSWVHGFSFKNLSKAVFLFLGLSFAIAFSAGKWGGEGQEFFLLKYLGFGITSFEMWVYNSGKVACYKNLFGNVLGPLLDDIIGNASECNAIYNTPSGEFNVYSYASSPYLLFGPLGVVWVMAVIGFFYAALHHLAVRRSGFYLLILSVFIYPLVMVFYDWQFDLTSLLYMVIIIFPFFVRINSRHYRF